MYSIRKYAPSTLKTLYPPHISYRIKKHPLYTNGGGDSWTSCVTQGEVRPPALRPSSILISVSPTLSLIVMLIAAADPERSQHVDRTLCLNYPETVSWKAYGNIKSTNSWWGFDSFSSSHETRRLFTSESLFQKTNSLNVRDCVCIGKALD